MRFSRDFLIIYIVYYVYSPNIMVIWKRRVYIKPFFSESHRHKTPDQIFMFIQLYLCHVPHALTLNTRRFVRNKTIWITSWCFFFSILILDPNFSLLCWATLRSVTFPGDCFYKWMILLNLEFFFYKLFLWIVIVIIIIMYYYVCRRFEFFLSTAVHGNIIIYI